MLKWLENDSNGTIVPLVGYIFNLKYNTVESCYRKYYG